jgi:hypothetical protein
MDEEASVVGDEDELDDWDDDEDDWDDEDDDWDGEEDFWDDEDDPDDDDDQGGEGFPKFGPPADIAQMMLELLKRCGGEFPNSRQTQRILDSDPALRARMERIIEKYGPSLGLDGPGGRGGPPGGKKPKRKRKGKR